MWATFGCYITSHHVATCTLTGGVHNECSSRKPLPCAGLCEVLTRDSLVATAKALPRAKTGVPALREWEDPGYLVT